MVVCDPCFKTKPIAERQLATRRIRIHKVTQDGGEGFSVHCVDLCEDHYQETIAPMVGITLKESK